MMKKGIIAELVGGLGNQIWIYLSAKSWSKRLNVPLEFDCSYLKSASSHGEDLLTELNERAGNKNIRGVEKALHLVRRIKSNDEFLGRLYPSWQESVTGLNPPQTWSGQLRMRGYFQDIRFIDTEIEAKMRKFFAERKLSEDLDKIVESLDLESTAFFHIRRGDYWSNPQFGILDNDFLKRAFNRLSSSSDIRKVAVFSEGYFPSSDMFDGIHVIRLGPATCNAAEMLTLMSRAKHVVIANSTLSYWGARFSRGKVYYPDPRHKSAVSDSYNYQGAKWHPVTSSFL